MKEKTKSTFKTVKLGRGILSVLLVIMMMVSMIAVSFTSVQAGVISNVITGNWRAIVLGTVERSTVFSLGKAMDSTSDETFSTVLSWTRRIVGGAQVAVNSQIISMCQQISAQLNDIQMDIKECQASLDKIYKYMVQEEMDEYYDGIKTIYNTYNNMLNDFNRLVKACEDYNSNPNTSNKNKLKEVYGEIYNKYYSSTSKVDFASDLDTFLGLISPYLSSKPINSSDDITDPNSWGNSCGADKTILDCVYQYLTSYTDYENNVYDGMVCAINQVVNVANIYMQSYRYWADLESMIITNSSSLEDEYDSVEINNVWKAFDEASQKLMRGINQMCYLYEDELNSYMRTYDTLTEMKISGYKSESGLADAYKGYEYVEFDHNDSYINKTVLKSNKVDETQYVYQFKMMDDTNDTVFAVRNSNNGNSDNSVNKTNKAVYAGDMIAHHISDSGSWGYNNTGFSLDYLNLVKNSYSPGGYTMVDSGSDLSPIKNGNSYNENETLIDNIERELAITYGTDDVYLPKESQYMLLKTDVYWRNADSSMVFPNTDAETTWYNLSSECETEINGENDIYEKSNVKNKEIVALYSSTDAKMALKTIENKNNGGSGTTKISTDSTNIAINGSSTLSCGDLLTIKVRPDEGSTVKSVVIKNKNGEVLETILGDYIYTDSEGNSYTTDVQEMLEYFPTDDEGYYTFNLPVPYQDATVEVTYCKENESLVSYDVTLNNSIDSTDDSTDAVLQFTSYDNLSEKSFSKGETVTVSVTPYNNKVCTGIVIRDSKGNIINNVTVNDITETSLKIRPTERIYSFTMPEEDISIEAILDQGYTVTVSKGSNFTYKFENLNCVNMSANSNSDCSWETAQKNTFAAGDTVTLDISADPDYYISDVKVYKGDNELIDVKCSGSKFSFVMPEGNVTVSVTAEKNNTDLRYVTLNYSGREDGEISFLINGKESNVSKLLFKENETVSILLDNVLNPTIEIIDDKNGKVDFTYNEDEHIVTFTMPSENVNVKVVGNDLAVDENKNFVISS